MCTLSTKLSSTAAITAVMPSMINPSGASMLVTNNDKWVGATNADQLIRANRTRRLNVTAMTTVRTLMTTTPQRLQKAHRVSES